MENLHGWAMDLKAVWNKHSSEIGETVPKQIVNPFVRNLEALLRKCEEELHIQRNEYEYDIQQLAMTIYEQWQEISKVRSEKEAVASRNAVPIGVHVLPPLPYAYDALEPYICRETMRLHHDKHHRSYVKGLNKAEKEMEQARKTNNYDLIKHWEREAAFHGAGHYLHTIFWNVMSPQGGGEPSGELASQIKQDFGSFAKMKDHFQAAADQVEGGGWALLVWSPRSHRLEILQAEKHQNLSQQDMIPLLVLDVWEHAYYLKYKNERKAYIKNWWNVVNWPAVEDRYLQARQLMWKPY